MTFKLLVVDDHPETRNIIVQVLQQEGYQVASAENGLEGLNLAIDLKPDLIILDFNMPVMNGLETCGRLRQIPELTKVPIIVFTGVDDPQKKLAVFDAGADDFLTKPTDPTELIERVQTLLETAYGPQSQTGPHDATGPYFKPPASMFQRAYGTQQQDSKLIVVMGARGGAGATTAAINLAAALAEMKQATALLDLDMERGHIGVYLNQRGLHGVNSLAALPDNEIAANLPDYLLNFSKNLQVLLAQINLSGTFPHLSGPQTAVLLTSLQQVHQSIVVDLGTHRSEAGQVVLSQADQILVCLRPERIALSSARHLIAYLKQVTPSGAVVNALMMNFSDKVHLPQTAVESFLGHPLLTTLSIPLTELAYAVNQAKPLVQLDPHSEASNDFRQLARLLLQTE
jgi:DNA-binding response OmpR family regulator